MSADGSLSLFLGTWKTRYTDVSPTAPIPIPIEAKTAFDKQGDLIRYSADTVYPNGHTALIETTFQANGQPYPLAGSLIGDSVSFRQTSRHSFVATVTRGGVASGTVSVRVSSDGFTMTSNWEILLPDGQSVTYRTIHDRQPG
jgi:hypothetical protein